MLAETYLQLLGNWPHWMFELTVEAVTAIPAYLWGRVAVKRHDRKHHNPDRDIFG